MWVDDVVFVVYVEYVGYVYFVGYVVDFYFCKVGVVSVECVFFGFVGKVGVVFGFVVFCWGLFVLVVEIDGGYYYCVVLVVGVG